MQEIMITLGSFGNYDEMPRMFSFSFLTPKYYDFTLDVVAF
jgi:hypothetical protein